MLTDPHRFEAASIRRLYFDVTIDKFTTGAGIGMGIRHFMLTRCPRNFQTVRNNAKLLGNAISPRTIFHMYSLGSTRQMEHVPLPRMACARAKRRFFRQHLACSCSSFLCTKIRLKSFEKQPLAHVASWIPTRRMLSDKSLYILFGTKCKALMMTPAAVPQCKCVIVC